MAVETATKTVPTRAPRVGARTAEAYVVRFDVHQRLQHLLLMGTVVVLALTGLPQMFSDLGASQWWVRTLGGLETVRTIHRAAAVVMLADGVYHLAYLAYCIGGQRRFECLRIAPSLKDLRDARQMVLYFVGMAKEKPSFDRFNYLEKLDYWAVFWGFAVMGGSGLILWFPVQATGLLPGEAVAVALTIHGIEAVLDVGWVLFVHLVNVHLAPWSFPLNPSIFTGKLSARKYAEDHPLEWERITSAETEPQSRPASGCVPPRAPLAAAAVHVARAASRLGGWTRTQACWLMRALRAGPGKLPAAVRVLAALLGNGRSVR